MSPAVPLLHHSRPTPADVAIFRAVGGPRLYGRGLVCRVPDDAADFTARDWLSRLDGDRRRLTGRRAEAALIRRLNEHSASLPLPPAAVLHDTPMDGDEVCAELLTVLTVVAKSATHVYLRDKQPVLSRLTPGRQVVVVVVRRSQRSTP